MAYHEFIWSNEIVEHIAANGVSQDDFTILPVTSFEVREPR
jgi:hypothetical protein